MRPDLEERGLPVFVVSAVVARGPARAVASRWPSIVADARAASRRGRARRGSCSGPIAVDDAGFTVVPREADGGFRVRGERPERWVRQTDFSNDEAVGYLADRLARLGVEDALVRLGATPGDDGPHRPQDNAVVFDWEPTVRATGPGPRGQDLRIDAPTARVHGRTRAQLEEGEEPEAGWAPDPVDEAPRVHRRAAAAGSTASPGDARIDGASHGSGTVDGSPAHADPAHVETAHAATPNVETTRADPTNAVPDASASIRALGTGADPDEADSR